MVKISLTIQIIRHRIRQIKHKTSWERETWSEQQLPQWQTIVAQEHVRNQAQSMLRSYKAPLSHRVILNRRLRPL